MARPSKNQKSRVLKRTITIDGHKMIFGLHYGKYQRRKAFEYPSSSQPSTVAATTPTSLRRSASTFSTTIEVGLTGKRHRGNKKKTPANDDRGKSYSAQDYAQEYRNQRIPIRSNANLSDDRAEMLRNGGTRICSDEHVSYYVGDFKHDARTNGQRGWLIGKFMSQKPQNGNRETRLVGGQYVVISPGTPNNLVKHVVKRVRGLTVKAPNNRLAN